MLADEWFGCGFSNAWLCNFPGPDGHAPVSPLEGFPNTWGCLAAVCIDPPRGVVSVFIASLRRATFVESVMSARASINARAHLLTPTPPSQPAPPPPSPPEQPLANATEGALWLQRAWRGKRGGGASTRFAPSGGGKTCCSAPSMSSWSRLGVDSDRVYP